MKQKVHPGKGRRRAHAGIRRSSPEGLREEQVLPERRNYEDLQRTLGNRAVQRVLARGPVHGMLPLKDLSLARLRRAAEAKSPLRVVQRQQVADEGIEMDTGPTLKDTGQVTIQEVQMESYHVSGKTLQEAAAGLDPEEWGRCRWQVDYDYETTNGKTSKVNITLKISIRMPVWSEYVSASPAAKKEWDRMIQALQTHEAGHADIARKWAPQIKERLLDQKEGNLKKAYHQALKELDDESHRYDDDSQHGQKQGVTLDTSIQ